MLSNSVPAEFVTTPVKLTVPDDSPVGSGPILHGTLNACGEFGASVTVSDQIRKLGCGEQNLKQERGGKQIVLQISGRISQMAMHTVWSGGGDMSVT